MIKTIYHAAETRGHSNHGWLDSYHTFSFSNYQNSERLNFGVLRVINDDHVAAGAGFGVHGHENMEIISIPLEGELKHEDSLGSQGIIKRGEIQVMSAGTGVRHSEMNGSHEFSVKFLQIWVIPNKVNVTPRYDQKFLITDSLENKWQQILSPNPTDESVWINQDAWFNWGNINEGKTIDYTVKRDGNGVYVFVIDGVLELIQENADNIILNKRDGLGVWDIKNAITFFAKSNCKVLIMDIPMH